MIFCEIGWEKVFPSKYNKNVLSILGKSFVNPWRMQQDIFAYVAGTKNGITENWNGVKFIHKEVLCKFD